MTARTRNLLMPNGHFETSAGVHQYAIVANTAEGLRRKTNDFHYKVFQNGGQVLNEQKTKLPNGSIHVLFTYEI